MLSAAALQARNLNKGRLPAVGAGYRWCRTIGVIADGRAVAIGCWCLLAVLVSGFVLCFIPFYPLLVPLRDRGGALAIPPFAERPSSRYQLDTWPFREYHVHRRDGPDDACEITVVIGDYFLLMRDGPDDRRIGLRLSVDPRVPSALVHFAGDQAAALEPLAPFVVSAGVPHQLGATIMSGRIRFLVDGQEVASTPFEGNPGPWHLAAGIARTRILQVGTGSSLDTLERRDPWSTKRLWLVPLTGLLVAIFPVLFGSAGPLLRWIGAVLSCLVALPIASSSPYIVLSVAMLLLSVLGLFSWLSCAIPLRILMRRPVWPAIKKLLIVSAAFGMWIAIYLGLAIPTLQAPSHRSPVRGLPAPAAPAVDERRVLVFGASTVLGEGLITPERERFGALLGTNGPGATGVEVWARGGALMKDVLPMEEEALRRPADVVILYLTFNDAINPSVASLWEALAGMNGFGMIRAFYDSDVWMKANYARKGPVYEEQVSEFVARAQRAGARVVLVSEPCADYVHYASHEHGIRLFHAVLARVAREQGALYVDVARDFIDRRDDILFVDSVHLNRHGHELIAARINAVLAGLFSPSH